jgi:trehalose-phosphatase
LDDFFAVLGRSKQAALLLDYDGTLAPFRVERHLATPYAGVRAVLQAIRDRTRTRLVIISGRSLDDLLPLLALVPSPDIWGCHGWERLTSDGRRTLHPLADEQSQALATAWSIIAQRHLQSRCERKPASVALHWRGLPAADAERLAEEIGRCWQPLAAGNALELHPFDGGLELRATGRNKASAVEEVLAGLAPGQPVAFLGDDLTDEDGFRAVCGHGLGILVRAAYRPTAATVHLQPPRELLDFLEHWLRLAPRRTPATREEVS